MSVHPLLAKTGPPSDALSQAVVLARPLRPARGGRELVGQAATAAKPAAVAA